MVPANACANFWGFERILQSGHPLIAKILLGMGDETDITAEEWSQICALSALKLGREESDRLAGSLGRILAHFKSLQTINTDGISPESRVPIASSLLRADRRGSSLEREETLSNTSHTSGEFIRVPPVLPPK